MLRLLCGMSTLCWLAASSQEDITRDKGVEEQRQQMPPKDNGEIRANQHAPSISMVIPFLKSAVEPIDKAPAPRPPLVFGAAAVHRAGDCCCCAKEPCSRSNHKTINHHKDNSDDSKDDNNKRQHQREHHLQHLRRRRTLGDSVRRQTSASKTHKSTFDSIPQVSSRAIPQVKLSSPPTANAGMLVVEGIAEGIATRHAAPDHLVKDTPHVAQGFGTSGKHCFESDLMQQSS